MQLGLHIADFTWRGGPPDLAATLASLGRDVEDAGLTRLSVMDHLWQFRAVGAPEEPMLEAYTTLGFLAGVTRNVLLHTLVTAVTYRPPGLLAKTVSTLDALSGGRAGLGIGIGADADEAAGLGLDFGPVGERFERLEETLRICTQMWSGRDDPFTGRHYTLGRTLDSPTPLSRPRPYLLVAGGGHRKTLPLVARYADACNIFGAGEAARRTLDVLGELCTNVGRDHREIDKTTMIGIDTATSRNELLDQLGAVHDIGVTVAYVWARNPEPRAAVSLLAELTGETSTW